jgi:hypothetical protein
MFTNHETAGNSGVSYEEVRKAGRELIPKIYKNPISKEYDIIKAAKMLTLPVSDRTLLFDGETDMNALADFWIHEFRRGGKTMIERCRPEEMGLSPLEAELLLAHQRTRTSLFEVIEAQPRERRLRLCDLLEPERAEVRLTDVSLSVSLGDAHWQRPPMIFFRIITVQGYEVTSGVSFVFRPVHKQALLAAHQERMNRVPPGDKAERRYVFFYRKQREIGEEQAYASVPGTT